MDAASRRALCAPRQIHVDRQKKTPLPAAQRVHYWHPQRFGVRLAPERFQDDLHQIHPDLEAAWSPVHERWIVWARSNLVTHPICAGWSLKFVWQTPTGGYLPLDSRVFADIYSRDFRRYGGAQPYFERLQSEFTRDTQKRKDDTDDESRWLRKDYNQYRKIKNIGRGNKFAMHWDGSIVPSAGEIQWRQNQGRL